MQKSLSEVLGEMFVACVSECPKILHPRNVLGLAMKELLKISTKVHNLILMYIFSYLVPMS